MSDRPKFSVCEFTTPDTTFEDERTYDVEIFVHGRLEDDRDEARWRKPAEEIVCLGRAGFDKAWEESQQ
jgi:hypothetical protein